MIRGRDHWRLSVQKLALRKRRAAFAVVLVALAVIAPVTLSSLLSGVRQVAIHTRWTEQLDPLIVKVQANENPYEYVLTDEQREQESKRRWVFLTEDFLAQVRTWPEVAAAARWIEVYPVSLDRFADRPQPAQSVRGVPPELLQRDADPQQWAACSNAIPLVIGERFLRVRYDESRKKLELAATGSPRDWIGREVVIGLGDNYAGLSRFRYDYEKRQFYRRTAGELADEHRRLEVEWAARFDPAIHDRVLRLHARIVGTCDGEEVLLPQDTAVLCWNWVHQRDQLAALRPEPSVAPATYGEQGRRTPRSNEFSVASIVVKPGRDVEAVARRIEHSGFYAATRQRTFENQARAFDTGLRVVKKAVLAFGAVMLILAGGLVWSTTSKIVSDSRADIGLFRALGATKRDIRGLFLGEAALLGVVGTVVGIVLGWLLAAAVSRWVLQYARREMLDPTEALDLPASIFSINTGFCLTLLVVAAVVALAAGLWPANRAANLDPVKALKRE